MESEYQTIRVEDDSEIKFPVEVFNLSPYLKQLFLLTEGSEKKLPIKKEPFLKFLQFCELNEYKELIIGTVKTNDLSKVFGSTDKNYLFLKQFNGLHDEKLVELYKTATLLNCKSLCKLIAVLFACEIYFEDTHESYEATKARLGIKEQITYQEDEEYHRNYVFMN